MLQTLDSLKGLVKAKAYRIDFPLFRLHYQVTVCVLLSFSLILSAKVLFGDTIDCQAHNDRSSNYVDNICFSTGTYTRFVVIEGHNTSMFKVDSEPIYSYPGVLARGDDRPLTYFWHSYYQYLPLILLLQAMFFYLPHYLWKIWEGGVISTVCKQLHDNRISSDGISPDLIQYLQSCFKLNRSLVFKYQFCQLLSLLNIVLQAIVLDHIFNKQFLFYGYNYFKHTFIDNNLYGIKLFPSKTSSIYSNNRSPNNPLDIVFPKMTSCRYTYPGQAGKGLTEVDLLCVLPLNILTDKFYLILWYWFLILAGLTIIRILKDVMYTILPPYRRCNFNGYYGPAFSNSLAVTFILDLIGSNSDRYSFMKLMKGLTKQETMV